VIPGKPYTLTIEGNIPPQSLSAETGLYVNSQQIAPLKGGALLTAAVPPSPGESVEIELRCEGWVPQKLIPGSKDPRTLGLQAFKITMRASNAGAKIFDANSGQWLSGP
jgi:hypothetical protein